MSDDGYISGKIWSTLMSIKKSLLLRFSGRKTKAKVSKALAQQALEPRLLLDAAASSTLAEAANDVSYDNALDAAVEQLAPNSSSEKTNAVEFSDAEEVTGSADEKFTEVYIIDESVPDICLLYTSPSPRDRQKSRMPSSA